jgi:hypothetical protein
VFNFSAINAHFSRFELIHFNLRLASGVCKRGGGGGGEEEEDADRLCAELIFASDIKIMALNNN